jgi:hypothetical protein
MALDGAEYINDLHSDDIPGCVGFSIGMHGEANISSPDGLLWRRYFRVHLGEKVLDVPLFVRAVHFLPARFLVICARGNL